MITPHEKLALVMVEEDMRLSLGLIILWTSVAVVMGSVLVDESTGRECSSTGLAFDVADSVRVVSLWY